jgi:hypothetical protein
MNRFCALVMSVCGVLLAPPAAAQHHVEYGINLSLGPIYHEEYLQGELPSGPIIHGESIADYGSIFGHANVGFGVNKARLDLSGTNPDNPFSFEYGFATSRYWDWFRFDDPNLNGQHGFFDATLFLAGSGYAELSSGYLNSPDTEFDAFWHAVINVSVAGVTDPIGNAVQSLYYAGDWYKGLGSTTMQYTGDPLNTYQQEGTFEFIYGEPILMDTFLQVLTQFDNQISNVSGTLDTVIDLGNSAYWGGIRNLRDANGNPVSDDGYWSSSGFDYRRQPGDFDGNGGYDCSDIDALVGVVAAGTYDAQFDLTGDGLVDDADLTTWLVVAGSQNLASGNPYLPGDANLDGVVDGNDFIAWNEHKFTEVAAWCSGDFTADGVVDGADFIVWNENKFTSSDAVIAVPEPAALVLSVVAFVLLGLARVRR